MPPHDPSGSFLGHLWVVSRPVRLDELCPIRPDDDSGELAIPPGASGIGRSFPLFLAMHCCFGHPGCSGLGKFAPRCRPGAALPGSRSEQGYPRRSPGPRRLARARRGQKRRRKEPRQAPWFPAAARQPRPRSARQRPPVPGQARWRRCRSALRLHLRSVHRGRCPRLTHSASRTGSPSSTCRQQG